MGQLRKAEVYMTYTKIEEKGKATLHNFLNSNIVVLDTCVCRTLFCETPIWFNDFVSMKRDGIEFCIADVAYAELIRQFQDGAILPNQWREMMVCLDQIVSETFPLLPGKKEMYDMIPVHDVDIENTPFDFKYEKILSQGCFMLMHQYHTVEDLNTRHFFIQTSREKCEKITCVSSRTYAQLQAERDNWIKFVLKVAEDIRKSRTQIGKECGLTDAELRHIYKVKSDEYQTIEMEQCRTAMKQEIDKVLISTPAFSIRADLLLGYLAQMSTRAAKEKEPYNPSSKKKRNDGLDFLIAHALIIPSRVCSNDKLNALKAVDSFQNDWIITPERLVELWKNKQLNKLEWPTSTCENSPLRQLNA